MSNDTNLSTLYPDYTEHYGRITAGSTGMPTDLMYAAPVDEDASIVNGSLISVSPSTGGWVMGLSIPQAMPCWAVNNSNDEDIAQYEYGFGKGAATIGTPFQDPDDGQLSAWLNAVVGARGYEMLTTEFDTEETYAAQDLLVAESGDDAGKVTRLAPATYDGSQSVVGQVSRGVVNFDQRRNLTNSGMLAFWTRPQLPIS